jgi:hypothetical protein
MQGWSKAIAEQRRRQQRQRQELLGQRVLPAPAEQVEVEVTTREKKLAIKKCLIGLGLVAMAAGYSPKASAQVLPQPDRSTAWGTVSTVSMLIGAGTQLFMPRVYYSENEMTLGWKARWHVSVLAPFMTVGSLAFLNEYVIKPEITSFRPGCGTSNVGVDGCKTFGMPSTHAFVAFSALGHGTAVWLFDSFKYSDGKVNVGALVGDVVVPLIAATFTAIGRGVNVEQGYEHFDQIAVGGLAGLGFGLVTGGLYSLFQRPECGYMSGMICW